MGGKFSRSSYMTMLLPVNLNHSHTLAIHTHLPVQGDTRCRELMLRLDVDGENAAVDANLAAPGTGAVGGESFTRALPHSPHRISGPRLTFSKRLAV